MKYAWTMLFVLAGCTVGPNYQKPDLSNSLPDHYQHVEGSAAQSTPSTVPDRWWTLFGDASVNQLVDLALSRNLDIASADATIRQARAQLGIVDSANQFQLSADGRVGRDQFSKNSENFANIPFPHPLSLFTDYRAGFDASWEIDLFGYHTRSMEAAQARLAEAELQRQDVALRVAAEVVRNVVDYRAWQLRSKNAENIFADSEQLADLIVVQRKAGLMSDSDVADAQTAVRNAHSAIPPLQAASVGSVMALTVLTDQSQEQVTALLGSGTAIPLPPNRVDSLGLPSELLLRRPDVRSAERELAATTADIGVAVADQYPRFSLVGDLGLDSVTPGKFTNSASRYWNVGPQLTVPLLSGGRLTAQVDARKAASDAALANYRQTVLGALSDTETALIRYQREHQRLELIGQAYASQQSQLGYAEQRYKLGDTNFTNVLQARQQLAQVNDIHIASQQALAENLVALLKALGGGVDGPGK